MKSLIKFVIGLTNLVLVSGCSPEPNQYLKNVSKLASEVLVLSKKATDESSAKEVREGLIEKNERLQKLIFSSDRSLRGSEAFSRKFDKEVLPIIEELHGEIRRIRASDEIGPILAEFTDSFKGVK